MSNFNIDSVDKLVEFGLSLSVAQQMVQMFNSTMQNMNIPGQMNNASPIPQKSKEWYAAQAGKATGPFTEAEMKNLLLNKSLTTDSLVWTSGMSGWKQIKEVPEILKMILQLPPVL